MERRREIAILNLLSRYEKANFKMEEVGALMTGLPLPHDANPTLLDVEQSMDSHEESLDIHADPNRVNYNVE